MKTIKIFLNNLFGLSGYRIYKVDRSERSFGEGGKRPDLLNYICEFKDNIHGTWIDVGSGGWGSVGSYEEIRNAFKDTVTIRTLDLNGAADIVCDITQSGLPANSLDGVFIFETLEHIPSPQKAIDEIYRILKPGGLIIGSTPFFYELHGEDYGDYWRFTRQGIREMFKSFSSVDVRAFGRHELKPHHYGFVAIK